MYHINFLSGGIGSWATGMRVAEMHGTSKLIHLFTDTKKTNDNHPHRGEDQDLYRFLKESWLLIGGRLEWISANKNVWQVFEEVRYMGNTRNDPCSRILKRELARQWITDRFAPDEVILYLGIDWTEGHRAEKVEKSWHPYKVEFPLMKEPYLTKEEQFIWLETFGVKRPRLYDLGFFHNNCGGFCVKAGIGHYYNLLKKLPERYSYHEAKQEELFAVIGKRHPFLRKIVYGETIYLSLREFREQIEKTEKCGTDINERFDLYDIGGCGCFSDFP